jgi:hypothetical protein
MHPYVIEGLHYSETIEVDVWILNVVDLYAYEFVLYFDPSWIKIVDNEVKSVHTADFVIAEEVDNLMGTYTQAVTAIAPANGFNGSAAIANLWFHIEANPCWPAQEEVVLAIEGAMSDSCTTEIEQCDPEFGYLKFKAIQPTIKMLPPKIQKWIVGDTFTVQIEVQDVVKMKSFHLEIYYGVDQITTDEQNVWIKDFLPPPYELTFIDTTTPGVIIIQAWIPCEKPAVNGTGEIVGITFTVLDPWGGAIPDYEFVEPHDWMPQNCTQSIDIAGFIDVYCPMYREMILHVDVAVKQPLPDDFPGEIGVYFFTPIPGDLNYDGHVDIVDLSAIAAEYGTTDADMDLNGDGVVDIFDVVIVAKNFCRTEPPVEPYMADP